MTIVATGASGIRLQGNIVDGSGSNSLIVTNSGTPNPVRLSGNSTFGGGVTIKQGLVELQGSNTAAGTGTITIGDTSGSNNATLRTGDGRTIANNITVSAGNSGTNTLANNSSSLSTFTGAVALNNSLTLAAASSGALTLSGSSITGGTGTNTITNAGTGTGAVTLSGLINNGTGTVAITQSSSSSTLTLSNSNNSYTGGTKNFNGSIIQTASGALSTGTITLGDGSTSNSATLTGNGSSTITNSNAIVFASGGSGTYKIQNISGSDYNFAGNITLNNAATFQTTGNGAMFLTGQITGSPQITIDGSGTTTKFVSLANNNTSTFTGNILVQNKGTLKFGGTTALGSSNTVTMDSTATMDMGGNAETIAGLNDVSLGAGEHCLLATEG